MRCWKRGLPLKATVMSWRGEAGGIKAAQLGNNVIMTPNTYCYLDYYQENPEFAPLAIGGFISLEQVYDYEPIPEALTAEEAKHIMGIQGNIWGEYVATIEKFEYMAFPRLLAIAEVAWSQLENKNRELFISRLKKEFSFSGKGMSIYAVNISDLVFREVGIVRKECMRLHLRLYALMLIFATHWMVRNLR